MIGSRVLGLQMVFTNYPLIYVLLKYFRLWYYTHCSHRTGLLKSLIRRTLEPRPLPDLSPRAPRASTSSRLRSADSANISQSVFRPLESGDLVHAIIADFSTSIEGHHRYPSGKKATHPANIILARLKQSIDPDFLSYLTCPSYFDHS